MSREYNFWVYIVINRNQSVLYIGVTNSLSRRTWRESQLKKWSRAKKVTTLNGLNPSWLDLGIDVLQDR
jgi:predicted GIY-YIG superfamily endonuclease